MKEKILLLSGWAYEANSLAPLAEALDSRFDTELANGNELITRRTLPDADIVLGWSMGGMLALERLPARCKKLILLSSTACFCARNNYPAGLPEKSLRRMMLQLQRHPQTVMQEFHNNVHFPRKPDSPPPAGTLDGLQYLLETDLRDGLCKVTLPTLILHGTADRIIPLSAAQWLHARLPNSTLHLLPEEGHAMDPKKVIPLLNDFL
jgi:pimeloyl-[acyl-carrier protein] methyl ester esterase